MPVETSPEQPLPVRQVSRLLGEYIDRLGWVWIDGQIAQISRRPGMATAFLTLRDTAADLSLSVTVPTTVLDALRPPLTDGARVVVHGKASFYLARGSLSMRADEIRPVGTGELLARLERLRAQLAAEGLFNPERKRPVPFLPRTVGLICGRASAAERDVLENARRRWPAVAFRVENTAVQGARAVAEVIDALGRLAKDPTVDVIVIARGGGSLEDLLPFSDETLLRAVAATRIPIVSAIGHEQDTPLLDLVADLRASTPTDAARGIVPDLAAEISGLTQLRHRLSQAVTGRLARERDWLAGVRQRPVLADPTALVRVRREQIDAESARARRVLAHRITAARDDLGHQLTTVRALSPRATLDRGYALVQRRDDGHLVRAAADAAAGTSLRLRLANGELSATSDGPAEPTIGMAPPRVSG
jgi:exodeoxyribonuclease VII large subunit